MVLYPTMNIHTLIHSHLRQHGPIPFVEFMNYALYEPNVGYYTSDAPKFGPSGDFITAPGLTPLFGYAVANQCKQVFQAIACPMLFEFGAGEGRLCVDILVHLETLDALPQHYFILEVSAHLKARQQELIQSHIPHLADRVQWLTCWPKEAFSGVVIANEVLDAMPVHRFIHSAEGLWESYIKLNAHDSLCEVYQPCTNTYLRDYIAPIFCHNQLPYQSEVNLFLDSWLEQCYAMLETGAIFLMDYGFPRHEYYHPDRRTGSLMCHYQHQAHTNPLIHVGEQDITAHVDFTHVAEAGDKAGFHVAGYTNQAAFLLANGLVDLLAAISEPRERMRAQQAVKQLTQPHEMGELFKVMALTKGLDQSLQGFQLQDKRASL